MNDHFHRVHMHLSHDVCVGMIFMERMLIRRHLLFCIGAFSLLYFSALGKSFFLHKPHFATHHFQIVKRGYILTDSQPEITSGIWLLGKNDFESEAFALIVR